MRITLIISFVLLAGCARRHAYKEIIPALSYADFLHEKEAKRKQLRHANPDSAKNYLFHLINDQIPAYWIGTSYDFNGTTRMPKEGQISCGYFVTNTLTDIGLPIDRVKLAQAPSSELVSAVCVNVKWHNGYENFLKHMAAAPPNSAHIVGLDFHTGYVTKTTNQSYFIHANWRGVIREPIEDCNGLKESKIFVVGSITDNAAIIKKWVEL